MRRRERIEGFQAPAHSCNNVAFTPGPLMLRAASLLVALLSTEVAFGQECPDAATAKAGFVLERNGTTSEVRPSADLLTHVVNRFPGGKKQDVLTYHGLVVLSRFDETAKAITVPLTDMRTILPLSVGTRRAITFVWAEPARVSGTSSQEMVVSGREKLQLGPCSYEVLVIKNRFLAADGRVTSAFVDLYSPELGYVLGKRYEEQGGRETVVKFETIRPLARANPL
jgi:hypothetical protein